MQANCSQSSTLRGTQMVITGSHSFSPDVMDLQRGLIKTSQSRLWGPPFPEQVSGVDTRRFFIVYSYQFSFTQCKHISNCVLCLHFLAFSRLLIFIVYFFFFLLSPPSVTLTCLLQLSRWCLSAHHSWTMRVLSLIVHLTSLLISPVTWMTWFKAHVSSQSSSICPLKVPFAYSEWSL